MTHHNLVNMQTQMSVYRMEIPVMRMQCVLALMEALCANASLALKGMEPLSVRVGFQINMPPSMSNSLQ